MNGDVSHRKEEFHVWVGWASLLGHDSAGFQCEEVTPWETASILVGEEAMCATHLSLLLSSNGRQLGLGLSMNQALQSTRSACNLAGGNCTLVIMKKFLRMLIWTCRRLLPCLVIKGQ